MRDSPEQRVLAARFRATPGGFVFRAPGGWRFWKPRHFLVDADLRARLMAASNEPGWVAPLWIAVPWILISFTGVAAVAFYFADSPGHEPEVVVAALLSALLGLAAGLAALSAHNWRRVAPLLRGAQRTEQTIPLKEIQSAFRAAGGPSRKSLFTQVLSGATLMTTGGFLLGATVGELDQGARSMWIRLFAGALMVGSGFVNLYLAGRALAKERD